MARWFVDNLGLIVICSDKNVMSLTVIKNLKFVTRMHITKFDLHFQIYEGIGSSWFVSGHILWDQKAEINIQSIKINATITQTEKK